MGLDLLLLIVVAVFIARQIQTEQQRSRSRPPEPASASPAVPHGEGGPLHASARATRCIALEGARHFRAGTETAFLKRFGLPQSGLQDACALAGPVGSLQALPPAVNRVLHTLLEHGNVRGADVTAFITGTRSLRSNESLYLALYEPGRLGQLDLVAFIDAAR
jgi:hypothetical protein